LYLPKPINNAEDIETTAVATIISNDNDIPAVEAVEVEGNNVSEEENDSVGDEV